MYIFHAVMMFKRTTGLQPTFKQELIWKRMQVFFGIVCIFLIGFKPDRVEGGGQLSITLVEYVNQAGKGDNLRVCDGRWFAFKFSACDHRFIICADKQSGGRSLNSCHFGRVDTPPIPDADTIFFSNDIQGVRNPILFNVTSWPASGRFTLKIDIWDHDEGSRDEHVEYLYRNIVIKPSPERHNQSGTSVMLSRRTRLTVEIAVFCDKDYFGESCDVYCHAENDAANGHYACSNGGQKQCLKGWKGEGCRQVDHCADSPCSNNATCLQKPESYSCRCPLGFVGVRCETRLDRCADVMCYNNGTCAESKSQAECFCTEGWRGKQCLIDLDECLESPCQGHSKCINTDGSYHCECLLGWGGDECMENKNKTRHVSLPECSGSRTPRPSPCPETRLTGTNCVPLTPEDAHFTCQTNDTCKVAANGTCCVCDAAREGEDDPDLTQDGITPPCLGTCSTAVRCLVSPGNDWVCNCTGVPCYLSIPEVCHSLQIDINGSSVETRIPPSYDMEVFGQEQLVYPCSRIHLTIVATVDKSDSVVPTNHRQEELLVMAIFENDTDCADWRQWISINCSRNTADDHQLDDVVVNYTSSDQSKSRSNSVNWYPLTALLVLPVLVIIACVIVLRKRLLPKKPVGGETMENSPAIFHNTLYGEIEDRN